MRALLFLGCLGPSLLLAACPGESKIGKRPTAILDGGSSNCVQPICAAQINACP